MRHKMTLRQNIGMEFANIADTELTVSRVGLGTWAIGGWMWGGTDEEESIATIHAAVDRGITLIDTAPAYGFGRSEEIDGRAIAEARLRSRVAIATKVGLEWKDGKVFRNASRDHVLRKVTDSLRRLRTDYIDIYQVHWPDPLVPIEETAETMHWLLDQGATTALWGARHPGQLQPIDEVFGWSLDTAAKPEIDRILRQSITDPVGPEFMAPPPRRKVAAFSAAQ